MRRRGNHPLSGKAYGKMLANIKTSEGEMASEHKDTLVDIMVGNTWEQSVAAFERALATAAKQVREEALEEAAKICDSESEGYGEPGWVQASANCAEAIRKRALAAQPSPQTKEKK